MERVRCSAKWPLTVLSALVWSIALVFPAVSAGAGTVSFDPADGILIVPVVVNGHINARFGLDSGADDFYLDSAFAARNDIPASADSRPFSVTGIGTRVLARPLSIRSLTVADEGIYNLTGAIVDLAGISKLEQGEQPDGLIGFPTLNDYVLSVDYARQEVSLTQSWPDAVTVDPVEVDFAQLGHWVALREAQTAHWFVLDLCASHSLISQDMVADLELSFRGDQVDVASLTLSQGWTLGPLTLSLMPNETLAALRPKATIGGIIGQNALHGLRLTIDYDRRKLRIEKP